MISGNSGWFTANGGRLAEPGEVGTHQNLTPGRRPTGPASAQNVVAGRRIDGYELLCAVGHGGMASVWAAGRRSEYGLDKLVAIKTLLPEYAYDERFRETFVEEARIASRIEHIHVARILDVGEDDHLLYLVTEWINGDSLSQLRRRLAERGALLPVGVTLRILSEVCEGLSAAHQVSTWGKSTPVLHRHLSPHNILVNTRGIAKVIDFGLADARDRAAAASSGIRQSMPVYTAPEQGRGEKADPRSDLWSVGAILYKLLSGKAPFQGDPQAALLSGVDPLPLPAEIHPAVAAVAMRALRSDAHRRFATGAELSAALLEAMNEARVPTTREDVAEFIAIHLGDRIAARHDAVARAVVFASQADRRVDRARRIIGRRVKVQSPPKGELSAMDPTTDQPTKVEDVTRDGMTGALAGLFGAIALLAVVASGLILRPAYVQKPTGAAAEPPPTTAPTLGASADTPETAEPASAPVPVEHPTVSASGAETAPAALPAKSKRTKGGKAASEAREVRKSEKHREAAQASHSGH
jgi:serine/threonine-protein kinase